MNEQTIKTISLCLDGEKKLPDLFRGMGVQWDPYQVHPVTENEWSLITKRVDYMQPAFVRLMIYAPTYCKGFDQNGDPIYQFDSPGSLALLRELDYLESRNIEVVLGEWEAPERFGGPFEGIEAGNPAWAKIICGMLDFLLNEKKYTCIHYFNYINEANAEWSLCADWQKWRAGINSLYEELRKHNLDKKIGITGPDSVWDEDDQWLKNVVSDADIHRIISIYDVHMYPTLEEIQNGSVQKQTAEKRSIAPDKDFYMTEVGMVTGKTMGDSQPYVKEYCYGVIMADIASQVINGGLNALAIWDLDDAMHNQGNGFPKEDIRSLKMWGFFNSVAGRVFGKPEEQNLRPHFFTWSLMCRFFRPGSEVLKMDIDNDTTGFRSVAMIDHDGKLTIMLVNHSNSQKQCCILLKNLPVQSTLMRYIYRESERKMNDDSYPMPEKSISIENDQIMISLPEMSVVFLHQFEK